MTFVVGGTVTALLAASGVANAVARTPTITGNGWVALLVIAVVVGTIYLLIMGTLHVEKRDAGLYGGRRARDEGGWFGIFHGGDGGDGGDGGGNGH
jgi:hypothetical protein